MPNASDGIVAKLEPAVRMLAEATDAKAAKRVADLARAAEVYSIRQRLGNEAVSYARAVVVDAMTLMGEFLQAAKPQGTDSAKREESGTRLNGRKKVIPPEISHKESAAAQTMATLKKKAPELHEQVRAGKTTVAKARVEVKRQEKRADLEKKAKAAPPPKADRWQVITGDVCDRLWMLADRPRLIFADPPYNVGVDYGQGSSADRLDDDEFLEWVESWVRLSKGVLAADGSFWLLISDEYAAESCVILKRYFTLRNWIVWYETFGVNCSNKFNRTKRHLFYCVQDPKRFVFNPDAVTRPSARQVVYNDGRASTAGKLWDDLWAIPRLVGTAAERIPDFPTQLPIELLTPIIGVASEPGDLILDPFSGSGTTGVASLQLGRRYVGIEKSATFADLSRQRLKGVKA